MTKLIKRFKNPNSPITTSGNGYVPSVNVNQTKQLLKEIYVRQLTNILIQCGWIMIYLII